MFLGTAKLDKGKAKLKESTSRLRCFMCDGQYFAKECLKREVLTTLSKRGKIRRHVGVQPNVGLPLSHGQG